MNEKNIFMDMVKKREKYNNAIYETEHYLVIKDINPKRRTHLLFIYKQPCENLLCLHESGKTSTIDEVLKTVKNVFGINKFTMVVNCIEEQEVDQLHIHIMSKDKINKKD